MQTTPNAATATPIASFSAPNAKAIGLFNKISGARKPATSLSNTALHKPLVTPGSAISRLNDRTALAENHFPDFFQTVQETKPTHKKKFASTSRNPTYKWSGNNDPPASSTGPQTGRPTHSASRKQTTIVDKSKVAMKLETWKDVKNSSSDPSNRLLHLKTTIPERPSTAGKTSTSNNFGDARASTGGIKGYVRPAMDKPAPSTSTATSSTLPPSATTQSVASPSVPTHAPSSSHPSNSSGVKPEPALTIMQTTPFDPRQARPHGKSDQGDVCFGETPDIPGVPVVYRSERAKAANPERLNLDRRSLKVMPLLEGEHMLRLLNLQNNLITTIDNLHGLANLIFLDLYNNKIESIDHLNVVPNLRVLMLGKNKLKMIEHLDCLPKLDVLDLHSNEIEKIEALDKLIELRVLNLAGNRITVLENISNLTLLTELNLRRNLIEVISPSLDRLPTLQRLFISNNKLPTKESLQPLFQLVALTELRLDGNIFNQVESPDYRPLMIQHFVSLRNLDLKAVTEDERRDAFSATQKAHEKRREQQREENQEAQRVRAITAVRKKWEEKFDLDVSSDMDDPWNPSHHKHISIKRLLSAGGGHGNGHGGAAHHIQIGFSEVEVSDESRTLFVYGDALEALDSTKIHNIVTAIVFKYIPLDVVVKAITQSASPNLQQFVSLKHIHFAYNQLTSLDQLQWIANLGPRAEELTISHNPVCHLRLLRPYVSHMLKNVHVLNGQPLTMEHQLLGEHFFDAPSCGNAVDKGRKGPLARQSSMADRSTNALIHKYLTEATRVDAQLKYMNDRWYAMVHTIIKETLEEVEDMDKYMSKCLERL
ncbi:hypothetical protein AC1031_008874 [Aphanomyces cochlioides]|nr:hypothetical protein AC1031_008874 [Aphanomyces cochlioides]